MLKTLKQEICIASYQTDLTARIKPSAILQIMQEIAGAHAELLGVGRSLLKPMNLAWVLTRVEVRMDRYPLSGEVITVETFPRPNRRMFFPRYFIFRDARGEQIGCGGSTWVVLNIGTRKMDDASRIIPLLPDSSDLISPMGMPATVEEVAGDPAEALHLPVYSDLDMNGHVNNTRYLDWCCNTLGIDVMKTHAMKHFVINFNREILPSQEVRTVLRRDGNDFSYSGFSEDWRHFDLGGVLEPV